MNRILLVGQDPHVCREVSGTLAALGFGVDVAHDSRAGLFLADQQTYSHFFIEHEIDDDAGIRLFERLSPLQEEAIGVLLTSAVDLNTVVSAMNAGMRRVLAKPIDYRQLLPILSAPSSAAPATRQFPKWFEPQIAALTQQQIREELSAADLIAVIRSVDYPFAGKGRLEHFDRDTLARVVHLICRWCRQRQEPTRTLSTATEPIPLRRAGRATPVAIPPEPQAASRGRRAS
jgi:DNA-binding response OmpR family regulator